MPASARLPDSRTALFGGTFDPVHNAHLEIARAAADRFDLRKVLFIPASNPPHKSQGAHASYDDRVRMVELACAGDSRFEVSRIEASTTGRSYSIDTIEKLRAEGMDALSFLIGADAFAEIATWHRWRDVIRLVGFIVVTRPGASYEIPAGATVQELAGLRIPVSSSAIRAQLAGGVQSVAVAPKVLQYILERGLYGQDPATQPFSVTRHAKK